jgi:hypothetical protein
MTTPTPIDTYDACPIHNADSVREYTFGMDDATVVTFTCGCAAYFANTGFNDPGLLFPDYAGAAGAARLRVASESAFANRYGF